MNLAVKAVKRFFNAFYMFPYFIQSFINELCDTSDCGGTYMGHKSTL